MAVKTSSVKSKFVNAYSKSSRRTPKTATITAGFSYPENYPFRLFSGELFHRLVIRRVDGWMAYGLRDFSCFTILASPSVFISLNTFSP